MSAGVHPPGQNEHAPPSPADVWAKLDAMHTELRDNTERLDRIEADVAAIREAARQLAEVGEQLGGVMGQGSSPAAMLGALMRPGGDTGG